MSKYAVTDLHGKFDLWQQIQNYCKPEDTIYFLGDAIDRGPDGIKIIKSLFSDSRVIYLKGNHEEMMVLAIKEFFKNYDSLHWLEESTKIRTWAFNGGNLTMNDFFQLEEQERLDIIRKLDSLDESLVIQNEKNQSIFLSHAGTNFNDTQESLEKITNGYNPFLWDRRHFVTPWPQEEKYQNMYMVHGHTPTPFIIKEINDFNAFFNIKERITEPREIEILEYCNGHKFCLDLASVDTDKIALFNLDTLKIEKYFFTKEV